MLHRFTGRRRGASALEFAIVAPVTLLLCFGLIIGGMGVFRYQETASLAREGARYASAHGGEYAKENGQGIQSGTLPNVDAAYIKTKIIQARSVSLDPTRLQVQVAINTISGTPGWDATQNNNTRAVLSTYVDAQNQVVARRNTVSVTVTYNWMPELYLIGPITLSSTSVMPMWY
jgi:Flp pilus assembly protein TadG